MGLSKYRIVAAILPPTYALSVFSMAAATLLFGESSLDTNTIDYERADFQEWCWHGHGEMLPWRRLCLSGARHF